MFKVNPNLMKNFGAKNWLFWASVAGIFFLGIFLRSYHFSDWMRFELDQARDASVIEKALVGGAGELPLLGPKARGTFLRLGPSFYYLEYASARIFGSQPWALAFPILFFSVLSLPLSLFLFLRYFSRKISLLIFSVFSVSIFLVSYSRFAWNPNPLIFLVPFFSFSLLKAVSQKEKNGGWWLVVAGAALSLASQMHFVAFLAMPIVAFAFLIFKRPQLRMRYWILAILAILFFYIPVFINEAKTGGDNAKEFFKAVSNKEEKGESTGILGKTYLNFVSHSDSYALILSGKNNSEYLKINPKSGSGENSSLEKYSVGILGALFFILGAVLLFRRALKEKGQARKDFLILNCIWLTVSFLLFVPISLDLSPRFFLLVSALPFVFLGIFLEEIDHFLGGWRVLVFLPILVLLFWNLSETRQRFFELENSHMRDVGIASKDNILKETTRVTYLQESLIVDYMKEKQRENDFPVYFSSNPRYLTAFEYLLKKEEILSSRLPYNELYRQGNYFFVGFSNLADRYDIGKYAKKYDILPEERDFGTLTAIELSPKPGLVSADREDFSKEEKETRSKAPKRYKWNEIFRSGDGVGDGLDDEEE